MQRLFVVLLAFIAFSALPGVAPLVVSYGYAGPDAVFDEGPPVLALPVAMAGRDDHGASPSSPSEELIHATYWRGLSLAVAYQFNSDALAAPALAGAQYHYAETGSVAPRSSRLRLRTRSYDAQAPPAV